jgi:hypothetical protein
MMWWPEVESMYVNGCEFQDNTAGGLGGAVDIWGGWMSDCAPPSLKWLPDGYSNKAANTKLQPYDYVGCTNKCSNGMQRQSDGCHCC